MDESILGILKRLQSKGESALELLPVYQTPDYKQLWRQDSQLYRAFSRKFIDQGHPTRGFEVAREGLAQHPDDAGLSYLLALALARGGNVRGARTRLAELLKRSDLDERRRVEATSLEGRLFKDSYERTRDTGRQLELARRSAIAYGNAAALPGADTFPAINAATMTLLAGDVNGARELARSVIKAAESERDEPDRANGYWLLATLGEAHLILGDLDEAYRWYREAVVKARERDDVGSISTMRRAAHLLKQKMEISEELVRLFYVGSVVAFSGHMIDHPERGTRDGLPPRFPAEPEVIRETGAAIRVALDESNATIGFCSAACGADLLFAEQMLDRHAELHVVLPFAPDDFYRTSVDFGLPAMQVWRARCDDVLKRATQIHYATTEPYLGDKILFEFVTDFIHGLAVIRAAERGVSAQALVVLDSGAHALRGGTGDFLDRWTRGGRAQKTIDLRALRERILGPTPPAPPAAPKAQPATAPALPRTDRQIKAMMFADVAGFGSLKEEFSQRFHMRFLTEVDGVLRSLANPPVFSNTWGDGLYLVFDTVTECAEAALRLLERAEQVDWKEVGMGDNSPVRIGLHAGPVFNGLDPIINRRNYYGSHVTRAARIEPVTLPGCAFVSEQFAALLTVAPDHEFVCEYIGIEYLFKKYDRCPLYRLARR